MRTRTQKEIMVDTQIRPADVTRHAVIDAFLKVDRAGFVPDTMRAFAYAEQEIEAAPQYRMMTPRSLAKLIDLANPKPHEDILLIGSALGYEAAILSHLGNSVTVVEDDTTLSAESQKRLTEQGIHSIVLLEGGGIEKAKLHGPFDLLIFNGAVEDIPQIYFDSVKNNGRIAAYIYAEGISSGSIISKHDQSLYKNAYFELDVPRLPGFSKNPGFVF